MRLAIIGRIGLTGDEAHYWTYFQHPSLSYFDHPPAIGYIIGLFTTLLGNNEFAVRLPAVLFFVVCSWFIFKLANDLFDGKTAFYTVILLNIIPVFSFGGSVVNIPDSPLSVLWILFVLLFWCIIKEQKSHYWYYLGVILGFGLLCKYTAILLIPSLLLFLIVSPKYRFWFNRIEPYIAFIISLIIFSPVQIWNIQNDWASFGFQLKHGLGKTIPHFSLILVAKSLGAQVSYISPLLFLLFWFVLFWLGFRYIKERNDKMLLLFSFSFPTLIIFNIISSFNEILPHWPIMGYLILTIALSKFSIIMWNKLWFRVFSYFAWTIAVILTLLVPLQALFKIIPPESLLPKAEAFKLEDGITKAEKIDVTNELYGWKKIGNKIQEILDKSPEPKPFVFTHRHYIASQLGFYIPSHPKIYTLSDRIDAYDFWQRDLSSLNKRNAIFITNDYFFTEPQKIFPFESWDKTESLEIYRGKRKVRIFYLTFGNKFDLSRLPKEYSSDIAGPKLFVKDGLIKLDHNIFWIINKNLRFKLLDYVLNLVTRAEDILRVNLSLIAVFLISALILWKRNRNTFWKEFFLLFSIVFIGGIIGHLIKDYFERLRPMWVFGNQVNFFYEKLDRGSFPSGHSIIAFAVATFLTSRIKKYWWLFFGCACFMGYTRVYVGSHFPSDVVAGAFLGTLIALLGIWLIKIKRN
ncbi:MAG: glycosyltransferase family 39 protein [Elusimicrobia bacterium]|nr:glycosyltransferase family 39 protein [Elusimicrobiota bacterium]